MASTGKVAVHQDALPAHADGDERASVGCLHHKRLAGCPDQSGAGRGCADSTLSTAAF